MKLLHLSDIHFGTHQPHQVDALLGQISGELCPELIVISGDMTQHATPRQFLQARKFLELLPKPLVVVPGNHDVPGINNIPLRLGDAFRRWNRFIDPFFETTWQNGHVQVLGLNSVRPMGFYWDWSRGHLNDAQLAATIRHFGEPQSAETGEQSGPLRVVAMHHPLIQPPHLPNFRRRAADRLPATLAAFARARVDLVLSGHFHLGYAGCKKCSENWATVCINAASTVSHRGKGQPNGINLIHAQPQHIDLEMLQWNEDTGRFQPWVQRSFLRQKNGWCLLEKKSEKI